MPSKIKMLIVTAFLVIINASCRNENHIDKYKVNLDYLDALPNNFYAYRGGRIYLEDAKVQEYRIWFNINNEGNVQDIFRIEDFRNLNDKSEKVITSYAIDTSLSKVYAQKFIDLSRQFQFGHIYIDKSNKVSFSCKDGLAEQYVKALNDSVYYIYSNKKNFELLKNGWFQNLEQ